MGLALYRKYRSKSLDDIVGQDHIKQVLKTALSNNGLKHAYLFTGPRGVGKTSIARILAHEINQLPYDENSSHLDIIEIDAASNRRIDEIRDLRDKVHIAPTSSKYKVYIIDEVHMLTKEAFNALLKTLEEPPEHVIFILATTEAHKVPDTILSRTQRFTFHPVPTEAAVKHLATIANKEHIDIDTASLQRIVEHAQGSLRDSLNMLDQMTSAGKSLTVDSVTDLLGIPDDTTVRALADAALAGNTAEVIKQLEASRIAGHNAPTLSSRLSNIMRTEIINGHDSASQLIVLLEKLLQVPQSQQPFTSLELALLSYAAKVSKTTSQEVAATPTITVPTTEYKPTVKVEPAEQPVAITDPEPVEIIEEIAVEQPDAEVPQSIVVSVGSEWEAMLTDVKSTHNTLYSVLRMAQPLLQEDELLLTFSFPFHQKQVENASQREVITAAATRAYGKNIHIKTAVGASKQAKKPAEHIQPKPHIQESKHLKDVSNIFEGAELLE